ncbi:nucleotide disphospho-sugar-binding domain-containing protein, partial [Agromyces seonyuensis]
MTAYLLCATPFQGHVAPVLEVGRRLVAAGHRVAVLTGSRFGEDVRRIGAEHRALDGPADFDDRAPEDLLPDRARYRGLARFEYDLIQAFATPLPAQSKSLDAAIAEVRPAAVLAEPGFTGVLPLLQRDRPTRPPVLGLGVIPLAQVSVDTAPFGLGLRPTRSALGRARNRALNALVTRVLFARLAKLVDAELVELGGHPLEGFALDPSRLYDRYLQLSAESFEYSRSDLSDNVRFVGAVLPGTTAPAALPSWWDDLDGSRPVVHVTQGTLDNQDFARLVRPTIDALADRWCTLVVSTGGRPIEELGSLPGNVRAAEFLPYAELLPKTDVMITNGGFGGVQQALAHGVPLIVAGETEDKPEVAARVAHAGAGVNLRTGTPSPNRIEGAFDRVMRRPAYRERAAALAVELAAHDAPAAIAAELEAAATGLPPTPLHTTERRSSRLNCRQFGIP